MEVIELNEARLPSFWDFMRDVTTKTFFLIRRSGASSLSLALTCLQDCVWVYTFTSGNQFSGHMILNTSERIVADHRVTESFEHVSVQYVMSLLFVDATMFLALPTLKKISLTSLKTK